MLISPTRKNKKPKKIKFTNYPNPNPRSAAPRRRIQAGDCRHRQIRAKGSRHRRILAWEAARSAPPASAAPHDGRVALFGASAVVVVGGALQAPPPPRCRWWPRYLRRGARRLSWRRGAAPLRGRLLIGIVIGGATRCLGRHASCASVDAAGRLIGRAAAPPLGAESKGEES